MTNEAAAAWAEHFWARAGREEPYPRDLESTVSWALPLGIVKLPRLTLELVRSWMAGRGIGTSVAGGASRSLRACLIARAGYGIVLLEGSDPPDERRMSLAHEVVHFLLDHVNPREKALRALGESVRAVLDGVRPPTPEERLAGVLGGLHLGVYTHLIERSESGSVDRVSVVEAEDRADRLALELLAPRQAVLAQLAGELPPTRLAAGETVDIAEAVLKRDFGLPPMPARRYARVVVGGAAPRSFRDWLGA